MPLFAATIALSAFLLFLVQPVIAKQILPWFGGSAAVWTTCMVFFQFVLLAGYAYSDFVIRKLAPRAQAMLHSVLLIASLAFLPITPSEVFKPGDADHPIGRILLLLAATIGLPYLILSTTGPLIQAWFARKYAGAQVYRLYALSNVASMLALIAYPPVIEPFATSRMQSIGWSVGYAVFVALALASAWAALRAHRAPAPVPFDAAPPRPMLEPLPFAEQLPETVAAARAAATATTNSGPRAPSATSADTPTPTVREQLLWMLLAALGSTLLLSVTTHITQNVASIPFLWLLPLSIYLLTFILCFDGKGWYRRNWHAPMACVLAIAMIGALSWNIDWTTWAPARGLVPIEESVALYAFGLFVICLFCHGELVERKPHAAHLTRFYLMISLGGALGGLAVGIVAPFAFDWYWELPLALAATVVLVLFLTKGWVQPVAATALCLAIVGAWDYQRFIRHDTIETTRNFYGALRVKATAPDTDESARWRLLHGVILHGEQIRSPKLRATKTTYYGPTSGVARAIDGLRALEPSKAQRVALIGLGVGTLAAYGQPGDSYRIYELNPEVLEIARRSFSFLADSKARIETPLGDARLVLEREPPNNFDVLAVDAFSSDSIPVHLITREAIREYRRHVADDGVIAFHVSNRYLDLLGVVRQLADDIGWQALRVHDVPPEGDDAYQSDWVLVTRNAALIARIEAGGGKPIALDPRLRPWTDDFNNLFQVLK